MDFVRQPQDADVHILSNSQTTGGGGREVVLRFVGNNRFKGIDHEHRALTIAGDTEDARRRAVLRTVLVGLLDYIAHAGLPAGLDLDVSMKEAGASEQPPARDPWNFWYFRLNASGSYDEEESSRQAQWELSASADRVTEMWKISFGVETDIEQEEFDLDEDEPFKATRRYRSGEWFIARSLGPHWSLGLGGQVESSTFGNTKFSAVTYPAVEYSIFPYREYATRQLVLQYRIGIERAQYNELTIFDELSETLPRHQFEVRLDQTQPWGSLQASFEFSQYLHDLQFYRLQVDGDASIRLARGFSLSLDGSASRIRDQLSLPRRDATEEEILLRLRELQSGYQFDFSIGISYSFGSLFNNIVNPRFGG